MMKDISNSLNNIRPAQGVQDKSNTRTTGTTEKDATLFKEALNDASAKVPVTFLQPNALKFSNHAVDRMQARGIQFSPEEMGKMENAAAKAQAKGAKNCLLISDQAAMIVDLKDKTVVTVMDKTNLKENVFTNIDSTVMV